MEALGSPIWRHRDGAADQHHPGFTPKKAGVPEHEVGALAHLDEPISFGSCRARWPG
jgi:hypothetical protein